MARYTSSKSVVKLQALVRGYLVRKKFKRLKHDYNEIVKSLEGEGAKVCWKTDEKLCLPLVFHGYLDTSETRNRLSDGQRPQDSNHTVESSFEYKNNSNVCSTIENDHNIKAQNVCVPENTNGTLKECPINNGLTSTSNSDVQNTSLISAENTMEKAVNCDTMVVAQEKGEEAETAKRDSNTDNDGESPQIVYPIDKSSLLKLREDLTMELLWIEQAIDSRINYLTVRENLERQLQDQQ